MSGKLQPMSNQPEFRTSTSWPTLLKAMAALSPATPAPTMPTLSEAPVMSVDLVVSLYRLGEQVGSRSDAVRKEAL